MKSDRNGEHQQRAREIQQVTGLSTTNFSDLVRVAQLVSDPSGGVSSTIVRVDWLDFGISPGVAENLQAIGQRYQYESPHVDLEIIWDQLTPETRSWFIANRNILLEIEEAFPALDED